MAPVHEVYRLLASRDHISVDRAMAAALSTADPGALARCATILLARAKTPGLVGLILHFHQLSSDLQQQLIDRANDLGKPLRDAARTRHSHGPVNMLHIVRRAGAGRLAYLVTDQLRHGEGDIRHDAATTLLQLANHLYQPSIAIDAREATDIADAVEQAVEQYAVHKQPTVLHAFALLTPRPMPKAIAGLADRHNPAIEVLRGMLVDAAQPTIARSVLYFLQMPELRTPAVEAIVRLADRDQLAPVLLNTHLLARPGLAGYLHRLRTLKGVWPTAAQLKDYPSASARMLPRWLDALPLDLQQRIEALTVLRRCPEPTTRLLALHRLITIAGEGDLFGVNSVISTFCDDQQMPIARMALRHLMHIRWPELAKVMLHMVASTHEPVRDMARQYLGPIAFDRLWQSWPTLTHGQRLSTGATLLKVDPSFTRRMAGKLTSSDRTAVTCALSIIHTLNQGESFEDALLMLASGDDHVVAASAVKALGGVATDKAVESLESALNHEDSRVRANAIEALQQLQSTRHVQTLTRIADEDDSRPRANAIGAMMDMRTSDAIAALHRMLADGRMAQRRSALWLVEHMGLIEVAAQVAELSVSDPDPAIKAGAAKAVAHLMSLMHAEPDETSIQHKAAS